MSVDIETNKPSILKAYNDLLNDRTPTDWILLGYEGQSNVLKFVSSGDGGLEELADDLNSSKVMYAVIRITDPKTTRTKIILINWQGESTPNLRKGTCARHLHDVKGLLPGVHVTINARNEEEVEEDQVMEALSKATATSYNFNDRSEHAEKTCPVGTNYKRTNPLSEINSKSRNKFWEEQEEEEKRRKAEEVRRKQEENERIEQDRKKKEAESASFRAAAVQERTTRIMADKRATEAAEQRMRGGGPATSGSDVVEQQKDEESRAKRAEVMRRERKQEAESLIGGSTKTARSMFEGMKISTQSETNTSSKPPPRKLKEFTPLNQDPHQQSNGVSRTKEAVSSSSRAWPPPSNTTTSVSSSSVERKQPQPLFKDDDGSNNNSSSALPTTPAAAAAAPSKLGQSSSLGHRQDPIGGNAPQSHVSSIKHNFQPSSSALSSSAFPSVASPISSIPQESLNTRQLPHVPSDTSSHLHENTIRPTAAAAASMSQPSSVPQNIYEEDDDVKPSGPPRQSTQQEHIYEGDSSLYEDDRAYEPIGMPPVSVTLPVNKKVSPIYEDDAIYEDSDLNAAAVTAASSSSGANKHHEFIGSNGSNHGNRYDEVHDDDSNGYAHGDDRRIYDSPTQGIEYQLLPEHGLCARALYDYQASDDTEISFDPSEIISNIEQIDEGWWQGVGPSGDFGLFPANYVELINAASGSR